MRPEELLNASQQVRREPAIVVRESDNVRVGLATQACVPAD
jgi:hypothetical protein